MSANFNWPLLIIPVSLWTVWIHAISLQRKLPLSTKVTFTTPGIMALWHDEYGQELLQTPTCIPSLSFKQSICNTHRRSNFS